MIVDNVNNMARSLKEYPKVVRKALEYLKSHDFTDMEDGRYDIDGDRMYASVQHYKTRRLADCKPEAHQKYVDVQYIASGNELLGWCPFSPDLVVTEVYDEEKDIAFYESLVPDSTIIMSKGNFAVLYPEDVRSPCGALDDDAPEDVVKVVVKISIDLF